MPFTREELEKRERSTLAPYAQFSADTRGPVYKEDLPDGAHIINAIATASFNHAPFVA